MLRGEVLVGRFVWLAVLRHYMDLADGHERGLVFSPAHALHMIGTIERFFVHTKGPKAGSPILLDPWQRFWTAVLYGWRLAGSMLRRFRRGYEEVARKNGKSTWKAPQGFHLFAMDGEIGAEVYAVATTREQAMTVFKPAFDNLRRMARRSAGIARSFKIFSGINQERVTMDSAIFKPLPANADNLDGINPSAILFDELHAQKDRGVWDVMESALGARSQPLLSAITTAGYVQDGICTEVRGYLVSVLEGKREDDAFFGYVYTLDEGDDAFNPKLWPKANPGLGSSKTWEYMHDQARKAAALPSALGNFKTKDLNIWAGAAEGWFDMQIWDRCGKRFDVDTLRGRPCYAGLDLSSTRDLTALALLFPPMAEQREWHLVVRFWAPEAKIAAQSRDDAANYQAWEGAGWITATPGNVTDYDPVEEAVHQAGRDFELLSVGFDRWNAQQLCNKLTDAGLPMVEIPQNTGGMYPGAKLLERLVYSGVLRHGGNPVLRYCADNTALLFDSNDNFRPDKRRSRPNGRIDGIVAACMAASRAAAIDPTLIIAADYQMVVA